MAVCKECGAKIHFLTRVGDLCLECTATEFKAQQMAANPLSEAGQRRQQAIEAVVLTTETAHNLTIVKRLEIITAECAFGMNIFKDLFAGVRDIVGGRSEAVQKTMRDARKTVLYELKREAHLVGGNAVVGVDLDYVEISTAGNMVMLVASGTAVVIDT